MRLYASLTILILQPCLLLAQRDVPVRQRILQISIVPALGTNGMHPGSFENILSLNLTSGYSASNLLFEIGSISNLNVNRTNGLQIAGLVNLTGANAFGELTRKAKAEKVKTGFTANLTGAQLSGLNNTVLDNVFGSQVSGGVNLAKGALIGSQLSGVANIVYKYTFGVQLSGLFNVSVASMDGVQIAGLSNYTKGEMSGVQIGAANRSGDIEGKNSFQRTRSTGLQLGLFNRARNMNGFQIGLVNVAKRSQGTQVGLINIYDGGSDVETRDGTAIGLFNFGDVDYAAVYASEMFALNYEISTGTRKNARILRERWNAYITNALIYSHQAYSGEDWAFGYGIKKMYFNRSTFPGMTESKFFGYGLDAQHINSIAGEITKNLSLLTRLKLMAGSRIFPKPSGVNCFIAATMNAYWTDTEISIAPDFWERSGEISNTKFEWWPGFSVGVLLH